MSVAADSPAVEVRGLELSYPGRRGRPPHRALRGVDLTVPRGQAVALLGPNGSGKSTLIRVIAGMAPPDAGHVAVMDETRPLEIRRRLSVVFQTNGLDPHLTVEENLRYQARLYGLSGPVERERIERSLARVGLLDRRNALVKTLSLGLARRADLARALLHHPAVLLLDEPTTGLDPVARRSFLDGLDALREEIGLTLLMTTHLIDEADRCDRVVLIHDGRIVADGSPVQLRRHLGGMIVTVHGSDPPASLSNLDWRPAAGGHAALLRDGTEEARQAAAALAGAGAAFTIAPPTLADVFAALTGATLEARSAGALNPEAAA